ncbi:MAG: substrate-binding domain-containing protein [Spirochaetales bacterium]|nr:substrate-binding domain-containing protein [Spirochaetales bacterium]
MGLPNNRRTIAFLIDELIGQYQAQLWQSMVKTAEERDVNLLVFPGRIMDLPEHHLFRHSSVYELISGKRIDGFIAATAIYSIFHSKEKLKKILDKFAIPYVSLGVRVGDEPVIQVDNKHGMGELVDHFIEEHGYKRIAFIRGPETNPEAELRYDAYKESLQAHGIPLDESIVETGSFWGPTGAEAVKRLLSKKAKFDGLVAANDDMALAALHVLEQKGYNVPGDVGVGGFDNTDEGQYIYSPLTTVAQPNQGLAEKSMDILLDMLSGKSPEKITMLSACLLVKKSCGCSSPALTRIKTTEQLKTSTPGISAESWRRETTDSMKTALETSAVTPELIKEFTDLFMDFITNKNKGQKDEDLLLSPWNEILCRELMSNGDVSLWNQYLTSIYNQARLWVYPGELDAVTSSLFQKLRILVAEAMERKQGIRRMEKDRAIFDMQYTGQKINVSFDKNVIIDRLVREIPRLGIKSFYVCLYAAPLKKYENDKWILPEMSELQVAVNDETLLTPEMVGMKIPVVELVPDEFLPRDRRVTYIIKSLFFMERQSGYIVVEYGLRETILYETIRSQISGLFHGAKLLGENGHV